MARIDVGLIITAKARILGPLRRVNKALGRTEKQAKKTARGLKSIDLVIASIVTGSLLALTKKFVEMGAEMENLRVRIGVFERGMGNVDSIMEEVNEQFGKTPFSLSTIGDAFVRLKASGIDPLDGSLKSLLDGVAAFGGSSQELQRAGIAIQQIAGKGVVSMEELRQQLGEAIPFAMRIMAQQMEQSVAELIAAVEKGELSAEKGLKALFEGLNETFGGVSDAMVNTMTGAFARLVKVIQGSADKIFNSFQLGPTIAATINTISDMIERMVASLTQEDIDKIKTFFIQLAFFTFRATLFLIKLADFVASGLTPIMLSFNTVMDAISFSLVVLEEKISGSGRSLEEIAIRFKQSNASIIGFTANVEELAEKGLKELNAALEKTKPLLDIISLGKVNLQKQKQVEASIESLSASLKAAETLPFVQKIERLRNKLSDFGRGLDQERERLVGFKIELFEAFAAGDEDKVDSLKTKIRTLGEAIAFADGRAGEFAASINQLEFDTQANFIDKLARGIDKLALKTADLNAELTKSEFEQELTDIQKKTGSIRIDFEKYLDQLQRAPILTEQQAEQIERVKAATVELNVAERQSLEQAFRVNDQKRVTLELTERQFQNQIRFQKETSRIDLAKLEDPLANIFSSDVLERSREARREITEQLETTRIQISELSEQALIEKDPARKAAIEERIVALQGTLPVLEQIKEKTTATALLSKQLWESVGDTIQNSLSDALVGLVNRTKTLAEVTTAAFNKITEAAADYLVQLLLIKAAGSFAGGSPAGGGGGSAGILAGFFAKGGAFKGQVKPFANGDVVRGPTLFGLAGEAGDEAILPLTRRNGKLGVEGGSGGDVLEVNISALDTQSAIEVVTESLPNIEFARQLRRNLNEGVR